MPALVLLDDRIKQLTEEDIYTLKETRYGCGDYPYSDESATKLVKLGLAYWIGGTAYLTETGQRAIRLIEETT